MKKMFVFDYDGTFYRNQSELLENIGFIQKARDLGHLFVIATGRSYDSFIKEVDKFNIQFDYLILSGGAIILDSNMNLIKCYPMDINLCKSIDQELEAFHSSLETRIFIDQYKNSEVISKLNQVIKMSYTFKKSDNNYQIQSFINAYTNDAFKTYVVPGKTVDYIEIISSKTDKGAAILELLKHLKTDYSIVAAGDSENDLEMLIAFDGYLMKDHDIRLDAYKLRTIDSIKSIICKELHIEDLV